MQLTFAIRPVEPLNDDDVIGNGRSKAQHDSNHRFHWTGYHGNANQEKREDEICDRNEQRKLSFSKK